MGHVDRRSFLELLAGLAVSGACEPSRGLSQQFTQAPAAGSYRPGRIQNEYSLFLHGEKEALESPPAVDSISKGALIARVAEQSMTMHPGDQFQGWNLLGIFTIDDTPTAIFEKYVSHRSALAYVTEHKGITAVIPKQIGKLSNIKPRSTHTPHGVKFEPSIKFGPDRPGSYILNSAEDPCYENVAALGEEYIGWALVGNEEGGPQHSLYLDEAGRSRQSEAESPIVAGQDLKTGRTKRIWAPDSCQLVFDPLNNPALAAVMPLFRAAPQIYEYVHGYSKRTLIGGYLPAADIGVWNPSQFTGYELMILLPPGKEVQPMARLRYLVPEDLLATLELQKDPRTEAELLWMKDNGQTYLEIYWNCLPVNFYAELGTIWRNWRSFNDEAMQVHIPDEWLRDAALAGLSLTRCSYRGLEPSYQTGEGLYTKFDRRTDRPGPRCSDERAITDSIFPVSHYEFVWAHQLWNHNEDADRYFQFYLDHYVLPNGELLYNWEAPLNVGVFLANSARSYFYRHDLAAFEKRIPILERMLSPILERYERSKRQYAEGDRRRGLISGSPEADLSGDRKGDPEGQPIYYQNAAWIWRGLVEHAKALEQASTESGSRELALPAARYRHLAGEMRLLIERSIVATIEISNAEMKAAGITPFTPNDTNRKITELENYENHRFMEDWFLADWGDAQLDLGHLKHRELSGRKVMGLALSHGPSITSNFMAHGTLSVLIRQEDYRPFLLTLYALACYTADSGCRYSPEDAYIPGGHPFEGTPDLWASVVNSTLQPTVGLRWLLCYEETDHDVCHLQKAAPKHWFSEGETISVKNCPTRFGIISWSTKAVGDRNWEVVVDLPNEFAADLVIHVHPNDGNPLRTTSAGVLNGNKIALSKELLRGDARWLRLQIS